MAASNDQPADGSGDNRQLHQLFRPCPGLLQLVLPDDIPQKDAARAGHAETEDGAEVAHHHHEGVGRHRVRAQMPENHGIHGEGHAPADVVPQRGKGQTDEVGEQQLVAREDVPKVQMHVLAEDGHHDAGRQLE